MHNVRSSIKTIDEVESFDEIWALWISPNNIIYPVGYGEEHSEAMYDHLARYCPDFELNWGCSDAIMLKAFDLGWVRMRQYGSHAKTDESWDGCDDPDGYRWDIHGKSLTHKRIGKVRAILGKLLDFGLVSLTDYVYLLNEDDAYWGTTKDYNGQCMRVRQIVGY
jgi:hypothetical protein